MGASPSRSQLMAETPVPEDLDVSADDIATFVSSLGKNFQVYASAIRNSGVRGKELVHMDEEALVMILASMSITNRLHQRKLASVCRKKLPQILFPNTAIPSGSHRKPHDNLLDDDDTSCSTASTGLASAPDILMRATSSSSAKGPKGIHLSSAHSSSSAKTNHTPKQRRSSKVGLMENVCVEQSMESLLLLVQMENQKRLLRKEDRPQGPPQGKAAIVLTDVQGSTALWEADPKAMRNALNLHDEIIRELRAEHGGYEIDTEGMYIYCGRIFVCEVYLIGWIPVAQRPFSISPTQIIGDAFFLAFHTANDALTFALALQEALREAPWRPDILALPEAKDCSLTSNRGLRVRMGIHFGPVTTRTNAVTGRIEYTGPTMDKAKQVEGCADGGQILTSKATWEAAGSVAARIQERAGDIVEVVCAQRRSARRRGSNDGNASLNGSVHSLNASQRSLPKRHGEGGNSSFIVDRNCLKGDGLRINRRGGKKKSSQTGGMKRSSSMPLRSVASSPIFSH